MKKLCIVIALAGVLAAPTLQASITVDRGGGALYGNNGGEFHVTMPSGDATLAGIGVTSPFKTFCLETDEYISMGGSYNVALSTGAVMGGANVPPDLSPDVLSAGTVWLFKQYWIGAIAIGTTTRAADFQNAIWTLENENNAAVASWISGLLTSNVGADLTAWRADATDFLGVYAMNLSGGPSGDAEGRNQDLLVAVPEPTTMIAGALLLLPFAASTLRRVRKNRTA